MRPVATPARQGVSLPLQGILNVQAITELLGRLPDHLQQEAKCDLRRRLEPEIVAWQEHWDTDDGALEPEEPLSSEDEVPDSKDRKSKKARRAPPVPEDGYPSQLWKNSPAQGHEGFNENVQQVLKKLAGWTSPSQGEAKLLPQQNVVACLLHPSSKVQRLLCDHNTGSGKTLCMVRIMDNFYFDPRGKIAIFPKDSVVDNFYSALWEWPNRWRDYCCHLYPRSAALACNADDWRRLRFKRWSVGKSQALQRRASAEGLSLHQGIKEFLIKPIREACEMKRAFFLGKVTSRFLDNFWASTTNDDVHPPAAPLRAYRFTSAGGRAAEVVDGLPRGCIFKVGFNPKGPNPYSHKVIVMDEGHHLTRPNKIYEQQLNQLRDYVQKAKGSVFVSCTGSMEADAATDPRMLLDVVKGDVNKHLTDEGFLSSHHKRGQSFPRQSPAPCADGIYSKDVQKNVVTKVELSGLSLVRYVYQAIRLEKEGKPEDSLANYTNMYVFANSSGNASCKETLLADPSSRPKFTAALKAVVESAKKKQKSMIMVERRNGYRALLALLQAEAEKHKFNVAEYDQLADFNSRENLRGQRFMVMILETERGGEGIELRAVRLAVFLDVPKRFPDYKQRCGRVVRCGSHDGLSEVDREVRFMFFTSVFPHFAQKELGAFALFALCGYWNGPKKITYASEPAPEQLVEAAKGFVQTAAARGIRTLHGLEQALRHHVGADDFLNVISKTPLKTYDQKLQRQLRLQFEDMAPALAKIRGVALDVGMY